MIKVGVLGSTGYAGGELVRLLVTRDDVELVFLDSKSNAGIPYTTLFPHLEGFVDLRCTSIDLANNRYFEEIDVLFCALPHGLTQTAVKLAFQKNLKIIDLSADFRIQNPLVYEQWYNTPHIATSELEEAVYGLCEVHREKIKKSRLIANPGCYPTSILLALYPLLKEGLVSSKGIICDSKSGVSGAGRSLNDGNLYSQVNENFQAYKLGNHRHIPEIEQELSAFAGEDVMIQFTPHLTPMIRGMLTTIYVENNRSINDKTLRDLYQSYYSQDYFIKILAEDVLPKTKAVSGSNFCHINFKVDQRTGRIILVSAIDNLIKGASGQAIQNMNLLFGLEENKGLTALPLWP